LIDTSNKLKQTMKCIDKGKYFVINRPRQYGKTTTIFLLNNKLEKKKIIYLSK
jgi:predicted AAA+ superfamily ATPase